MAVVALKSTVITNATAQPVVPNSASNCAGKVMESQALFTVTSGNTVASTYRLFPIKSSDRVSRIHFYSPDIGTASTLDIGLYDKLDHPNGGTVVDADFFASALDIHSGALNGVDITFEAAAAGGLIANAEKRIWEALGLTADPCKEYHVTATLATADSDGTGTCLLRMQYVPGI
jgi:hypothetical protein